MQWFAQAPANIALIKYMGKTNEDENIPENPSFSYTLDRLLSNVMIEEHPGSQDFWAPLSIPGAPKFQLSKQGQERYLAHLAFLKKKFNYRGAFVVHSSNNFPHGSGLASSASSFAALTKCAILALCELKKEDLPSIEIQATLARHGSGSACRSFFSPWALWDQDTVTGVVLPYSNLIHQVILVSHEEKSISSSAAHRLVKTSNLYSHRAHRAQNNLKTLMHALEASDWASAYQVTWKEFHDMHHLFATATPPFSYINEQSQALLTALKSSWDRLGDGPLITMDAGPNIHLLYRPDQADMALRFKHDQLIGEYDVL